MSRALLATLACVVASFACAPAVSRAQDLELPPRTHEIPRGTEVVRDADVASAPSRAERQRLWREQALRQRAELDGIVRAGRERPVALLQRDIEAAKLRHRREDLELQRTIAVRSGQHALVRRLTERLAGVPARPAREAR